MLTEGQLQGQVTTGSAWAVGRGRLWWGPRWTHRFPDCPASLVPAESRARPGASVQLCT